MKVINWIACIFVLIGALNWGLIGAFHYNVIATFLGAKSDLTRLIYILIGLSGIWSLFTCWKKCS